MLRSLVLFKYQTLLCALWCVYLKCYWMSNHLNFSLYTTLLDEKVWLYQYVGLYICIRIFILCWWQKEAVCMESIKKAAPLKNLSILKKGTFLANSKGTLNIMCIAITIPIPAMHTSHSTSTPDLHHHHQ